ncbi:hypothetical protein HYPSUDRAFT_641252 [Hypholoma sublateritium FD-334 SS-4]|uniref:Uncharacterized protein n=1 Tax=Hypholoma sublateritium (strain FD-334 SS-4) TaxID=945553 RepID=A0A0D2MGR6_HYPSF|nr:hypothetical protein HYPSUDRAFT_641252 [Hypholoma sublateritium FD-334 SS-4]
MVNDTDVNLCATRIRFQPARSKSLPQQVTVFSQALSGRKLEIAKEISFLASNANRTLRRPLYLRCLEKIASLCVILILLCGRYRTSEDLSAISRCAPRLGLLGRWRHRYHTRLTSLHKTTIHEDVVSQTRGNAPNHLIYPPSEVIGKYVFFFFLDHSYTAASMQEFAR